MPRLEEIRPDFRRPRCRDRSRRRRYNTGRAASKTRERRATLRHVAGLPGHQARGHHVLRRHRQDGPRAMRLARRTTAQLQKSATRPPCSVRSSPRRRRHRCSATCGPTPPLMPTRRRRSPRYSVKPPHGQGKPVALLARAERALRRAPGRRTRHRDPYDLERTRKHPPASAARQSRARHSRQILAFPQQNR